MIGGNKVLKLKRKTGGYTLNAIGERIPEVVDFISLTGFLDLSGESTKYTTFNSKIQESDHVFICDYVKFPLQVNTNELTAEVDGKAYDVMLVDNPMELNKHYEIFLRYVGD